MKKYDIDNTGVATPHSDGDWVPAEVAQHLHDTLWFVLSRIDGDLRATARDINNSLATGNDIYDDCDLLEERIHTALATTDGEDT